MIFKLNYKGELFTTSMTTMGIAGLRLLSSVILTRILYPEAFGIVTLVGSILFIVEMMSDFGSQGLAMRDPRGEEPAFLRTLWSVRLFRSFFNAALLYVAAPYLAGWYGEPALITPLRILSLWFVAAGLESMSYILSIRRQTTRKTNFIELGSLALSTLLSIVWSYHSRDHMGIIYSMVFNRVLMTLGSYVFYNDVRLKIHFERQTLKAQWMFARYVIPSSIITLVVAQFDKILFLRLFDLQSMGLYGLASNILGPVDALIDRLSRNILYPRMAANFRLDPSSFLLKYYRDSWKLHVVLLAGPALLLGMGTFVIQVLYDPRYIGAGVLLQFFAVRSLVNVFSASSEDLLVASGHLHIQLVGNIVRVGWLIPLLLTLSHFYGLTGFMVAIAVELIPTAAYYYFVQSRNRLVIWKYEAMRLAFVVVLATLGYLVATIYTNHVHPLLFPGSH